MSASATATIIVGIMIDLGVRLAKLANIPFETVMSELAKRTNVETSELDAAAKEQDKPLEGSD